MSSKDPMIGRVLNGTIQITRLIGRGGMGNVYEAMQTHLERRVAVKIMRPEHAANPMAADYFLREARQASRIRHPNIIQVIDFGKDGDDVLFLAMEFVPGKPLSSVMIEESPLPVERIIAILSQTMDGLAEAHTQNLVHRDIKPDNLMIEKTRTGGDFVKILDFGISQTKETNTEVGPLTHAGALVGTPHYMSPEQARGARVDHRSDLFSMGVILYEMLTGMKPFTGKHVPEILMAVIQTDPALPSAVAPDREIDPELEAVCLRALNKSAELRYQNASEFRAALQRVKAPKTEATAPAAAFIFKRSRQDESTLDQLVPVLPGKTPQLQTEPQTKATRSRFGIDTAELRQDLIGEKRVATAVVSHHRTNKHLSSEDLSTYLTLYESTLAQVALRWGGVVHSRQGAYATMLFGVERTSLDDGSRATHAAIDLREQLHRLMPSEFAFGIAIAQGEVFMRGGDISQATGRSLDDAIDAARGAADDEILVGAELDEQLAAAFRLGPQTELGPRPVLGVLDASQQPVLRTSNLVGRDEEVAIGLSALATLGRGHSAMFAALGRAGMGKTALIREIEAFAEQRGHLILRAISRAPGVEGMRDAMLQWLKDLARVNGRSKDVDILFREIGLPLEPAQVLVGFITHADVFGSRGTDRSLDSQTSSLAAVELAFRALLKKIQQARPVVLTLDQLDDFDRVNHAWFVRWANHLGDARILWMLGIRVRSDHALHDLPEGARSVHLGALDEAATRLLLQAELPSQLAKNLLGELATMSDGSPLQLRQLIDYVKRHNVTSREQAESWLVNARHVNSILQMRLFDLKRHERNLLAVLSVLGGGTLGEVLFDLASDDWQPEAAIQDLYVEGVIDISGPHEAPILAFRPSVFEKVVYDRLPAHVRAQLHRRAVAYFLDRIKTTRDPEKRRTFELAAIKHLLECGRRQDAIEILDRISAESIVAFEYELAQVYLQRAVAVLTDAEAPSVELAQRNLKIVRVMGALGDTRAARDLCRAMDRDTSLPEELLIEIRIEQAYLWLKDEDPDLILNAAKKVVGSARQLVEASRTDDTTALLARGLQLIVEIQQRLGRFAQAIDAALEAMELVEKHNLTAQNPWGPRLLWEPVNQLARLRIMNHEHEGANALLAVALRIVQDLEDPRGEMSVRANYAVLFAEQGRMDAALQSAQAALKIATDIHDLHSQSRMYFNLGNMYLRQRRRDLAEENFRSSQVIAEQLDWREGIAMCSAQLTSLQTESTPDSTKPRR